MVNFLMSRGADITAVDEFNRTAVHYAAANSQDLKVLEFLLDQKFNINAVDCQNCTPLYTTIFETNSKACEVLLRHGAKMEMKGDSQGDEIFRAPLQLTMEKLQELIEIIERGHGSDQLSIIKVLFKHLTVLMDRNLKVDDGAVKIVNNNTPHKEIHENCKEELGRLKLRQIYRGISFYNVVNLQCDESKNRFPIYFDWVKDKIEKEAQLQKYKASVAIFLSEILGVIDPFHLVIRNIISFLTVWDLKKIGSSL